MNEGRPIAQGNPINSTAAPTLRPQPAAGVGLRPQPGVQTPGIQHAGVAPQRATIAPPPIPAKPVDDEPLELVDEEPAPAPVQTAEPPKSKIHGISAGASLAHHHYKRPTHSNKTGAVRMRTFHCRLSEQGVEYLDQTVNDWLESHPDIEIKFTNSTIGLWDGKLKEPTLIINVWY